MFSSWKIYLGIGIAFMAMLGLGYWYFSYSQDRIAKLEADKAKLEISVEEQKKTIAAMRDFTARQNEALKDLQENLSDAEAERDRLSNILVKHDLSELARRKPELIEKRINDATRKLLEELGGKR